MPATLLFPVARHKIKNIKGLEKGQAVDPDTRPLPPSQPVYPNMAPLFLECSFFLI